MDWRGELIELETKWEGKAIFCYPNQSLEDAEALYEALKKNAFQAALEIVLRRCMKSDGTRRFDPEYRQDLLRGKDPNVILALSREISAKSTPLDFGDAEKKS